MYRARITMLMKYHELWPEKVLQGCVQGLVIRQWWVTTRAPRVIGQFLPFRMHTCRWVVLMCLVRRVPLAYW